MDFSPLMNSGAYALATAHLQSLRYLRDRQHRFFPQAHGQRHLPRISFGSTAQFSLIEKNGLPAISAGGEVINGSRIFDSAQARHGLNCRL